MDKKFVQTCRSFLHEIATPMTILRLILKRINDANNGKIPPLDKEKLSEMLKEAMDQIGEMEKFHANHKVAVFTQEESMKKSSIIDDVEEEG